MAFWYSLCVSVPPDVVGSRSDKPNKSLAMQLQFLSSFVRGSSVNFKKPTPFLRHISRWPRGDHVVPGLPNQTWALLDFLKLLNTCKCLTRKSPPRNTHGLFNAQPRTPLPCRRICGRRAATTFQVVFVKFLLSCLQYRYCVWLCLPCFHVNSVSGTDIVG